MKYDSGTASVPADSLSANVLAGRDVEFIDQGGVLILKAVESAAGLNVLFNIGGIIQVDDMEIPVGSVMPNFDVDPIARVGVRPGAHLVLQFRNTTAGALIYFYTLTVGGRAA